MTLFGERPAWPDEEDVLRATIEQYLQDLHVAMPGRVQRYYPETQEADVVPMVRHSVPRSDGGIDHEVLPVIPSVPVLHPRTANAFVHLPIAAGDFVLLVFTSTASEKWRSGDGSLSNPGDQQRHALGNAVALPGLFPRLPVSRRLPITDGPSGNSRDLVIGMQAPTALSSVTIDRDGVVHLGGAAGEQLVALKDKVESALLAMRNVFNSHTHPAPGGATSAPSAGMSDPGDLGAVGVKARGA